MHKWDSHQIQSWNSSVANNSRSHPTNGDDDDTLSSFQVPVFIEHHLHWTLPSHLQEAMCEQSLSLYLYLGVSNLPRHISSSFNIYTQLRVSIFSAGKAQKTNMSTLYHTQSCQYQEEMPMLSQDNLRYTQKVGEVEPKWDSGQYADDRIWKSFRLNHTFTSELLFKKRLTAEESTSTFSSLIAAISTSNHTQLAGRLHPILADTDLALVFHTLVTWLYYSKQYTWAWSLQHLGNSR